MNGIEFAGLFLAATVTVGGCNGVTFRPLHPTAGEPASPPARLERVTVDRNSTVPGEHDYERRGNHEIGLDEWSWPAVTRAGLVERKDDLRLENTVLWEVRLDAGARADVVDLSWSPASAPRCQGSRHALDILVDDSEPIHGVWIPGAMNAPQPQVHWERPIALRGEHVITGRFAGDDDKDEGLLASPSVIDVELVLHEAAGDRGVCVRVPATGPGVVFHRDDVRWSVGGRLSWRRSLAFSESSTLAVGLAVGRWVGPVRLGLAGTIGGADTSTDGPRGTRGCYINSGPDCDDIFFGTAALEAGGLAWRWGRLGLGWSASYETIFASVTPSSPEHPGVLTHAISGGPRVGLQLLRTSEAIPGTERVGPTSAWGVELFAAQATELRGAARGAPVTFGASLLWF